MASAMPTKLRRYLSSIDPEAGVMMEEVLAAAAQTPVLHRKVVFCLDQGVGHRAVVDEHSLCSIVIDLDRQLVAKYVEAFGEFGIVEREAMWLSCIEGRGIAPRLDSVSIDRLNLEYVGEPVRQHNLPPDWSQQAADILDILESVGCSHNDIKCDNLTVRSGKIHLIDYGWATCIGDPIPADWPKGIGRQHRFGIHQFDDRAAIFAALESAERGEVDRSVVMSKT